MRSQRTDSQTKDPCILTWPFKGHQTLEENQQRGLRGNIKVKKNKKKEVEKEIGKERKGKGEQRPILEKTDADTKQEYAAMKKEQG